MMAALRRELVESSTLGADKSDPLQVMLGVPADVLQLPGLLAGDVKESRNGNPIHDLQMAGNRDRRNNGRCRWIAQAG
jgi:hypothetical protein